MPLGCRISSSKFETARLWYMSVTDFSYTVSLLDPKSKTFTCFDGTSLEAELVVTVFFVVWSSISAVVSCTPCFAGSTRHFPPVMKDAGAR